MEKTKEKTKETKVETKVESKTQAILKKKVSKAWEAAQRLKGSVIINDPTLYWR